MLDRTGSATQVNNTGYAVIGEYPVHYREVLDAIPAMVAYVDRQLTYRYVNSRYAQKYLISPDEIIGRTVAELNPAVFGKIEPYIRAALAGEEQKFEMQYTLASGETRAIEASYRPDVDSNNFVRGFHAYIQDIHERKQAEISLERFRYAFDQGMEGFALHDGDGNFTYINDAQALMYGYATEEVIGCSWKMFYDPAEVHRIEEKHFPELLDKGKWRGELKGRRKSGELFDVEVALTVLTDDGGNPAGLVCNCKDVTQRKIAEQSMRQLQKMDALGKLTGGVAHDFNNLLAIIVGNLDILGTHVADNPQLSELVARALNATERGATLTDRLLAFARKQSLQPKVIDLCAFLEGMRELIHSSVGEQVAVSITYDDAPLACKVDPSQLENALLNLSLNARDAMPDGGELSIALSTLSTPSEEARLTGMHSEADFLMLAVSDTGIGMNDDVREKMFDPFFTTKDSSKGSGLGLSMVHGFVAQSGGRLQVSSQESNGTTVSILLPRSGEPIELNDKGDVGQECPRGNGELVLVVEDHYDVLDMVSAMLDSLGYRVVEASDSREAMHVIAENPDIALVLSDVILPGNFNGPELVATIRQRLARVKVVFMSGYTAGEVDCGPGVQVVSKPFSRKQLAKALRGALSRQV